MTNPLLDTSGLPLFDRIAPEHVAPALDELLAAAEKALDTVTAADFPADWKAIAQTLDDAQGKHLPHIIVDLAAQTAAPMAHWIQESDLFAVMADIGVKVNFWHVADAGKDSVDLLGSLIDTYGAGPNYVVVKNLGRGSDFSQLENSDALKKALEFGAQVVSLGQLQESSMRKIDRQDASFWAAVNQTSGSDALGLLERQRAKHWLKKTYETLRTLPL